MGQHRACACKARGSLSEFRSPFVGVFNVLLLYAGLALLLVVLSGCGAHTSVTGGETHIERTSKLSAPVVEHRTGTIKRLDPYGLTLSVEEYKSESGGGDTESHTVKAEAHGASGLATGDKADLKVTGDAPIISTSEGDSGSGGSNKSWSSASITSGSGLRSPWFWIGILFLLGAVACAVAKPKPLIRGAINCTMIGGGMIFAAFYPGIAILVLGGALVYIAWPYLKAEWDQMRNKAATPLAVEPLQSALDAMVHGWQEAPKDIRDAITPYLRAQSLPSDQDQIALSLKRGGYHP